MNVAFLGLGMMGSAMARRLIDAGHDVVVWNRTPEKSERFTGDAAVATTPEGAASGREVVFTTLTDPAAVREVVLGDGGALAGMAPGSTLVEMSTIGPDAVREISQRMPAGIDLIDAPVLGSVPQATEGTLKIFVGASEEQFARYKDLLSVLGKPSHIGRRGCGAAMKLVANSILGTLMTGLGEALALGKALGLGDKEMLDVLVDSPIGATVSTKRDKLESGSYPPNFKLGLASKDLNLVCGAAERAGVDLKLGRCARSWFRVAVDEGFGELDYSAVLAAILGRDATG
jgi:3-hydroxyisobutyrate dehydrogenase-like beta-hydroxyacid dehydrogenase